MTEESPPRMIIGYRHGDIPPGANSFPATARIDEVDVTHNLSVCVQPDVAIDIGRSLDGDVVWVSQLADPLFTPRQPQLFVPEEYLPEFSDCPDGEGNSEEFQEKHHQLLQGVVKYRKPALFAAGVVVAILGITLFLPRFEAATEVSDIPRQSSSFEPTTPEGIDPTSAAISFVLDGEVEGLRDLPDAQASDFTATVVSQSGEIVLVDVMRNDAEGLTTFATLLLQKSGAAWRIREVFDPR